MQLSLVQEPAVAAAAAIVYDETMDVDAIFAETVAELRRDGVAVAGLLQKFVGNPCDARRSMWLENLSSGALIRLDQPRGLGASACVLDPDALARAACVLRQAISSGPDLILVNRFGHAEARIARGNRRGDLCGRAPVDRGSLQSLAGLGGIPRRPGADPVAFPARRVVLGA
jgi:hypothetical protein